MKKAFLLLFILLPALAFAQIRVKIKNLVHMEGLSENTLIGYGIISGLNGTGDTKRFTLTQKILGTVLNNLGLDIENEKYYSQNTALVLLTAKLPPNVKTGEKINVNISSMGDAKNLAGGILLQAALKGLDDKVYAVAQGPVTLPADNTRGQRNNMVSGLIPDGAITVHDFASEIIKNNKLILSLKNPDFSTLIKIKEAALEINPGLTVTVLNNKLMEIDISDDVKKDLPGFLAALEETEIEPSPSAKIVINKNTGIIVLSGDIKLHESAVSYKNLDINIRAKSVLSPLDSEDKKGLYFLDASSDIQSLITALNKIGAKTEDITSILTALKDSGALYADIVIE